LNTKTSFLKKRAGFCALRGLTNIGLKEIGKVFGGLHYSAVSKAAARLERELLKDKDLAKLFDRLVSNVKT
jgi:chromosomal replication initiation ATPase DnaA